MLTFSKDFPQQADRFMAWCKTHALPLWASKGVDPKGGFWETLHLDASPDREALRRVRVQARQTYVYAHAGALQWLAEAQSTSDHGWAYLTHQGFQGGYAINGGGFAGCAHLLEADGRLHDGLRDTYAQAFLVLCSAWRYRAFADTEAKTMLEKTVGFLNDKVKAHNGGQNKGQNGWLEGIPASLPRRQNPHMHLFEAFLAAYDATKEKAYLDLAKEVFALFEAHFFDADSGCLLEFFNQDWQADEKTGTLTEPGHMMEWCWLLHNYASASGHDVSAYAERLYQNGIKFGLNENTGLLINECRIDGTITNGQSRMWPQTEFIKANIARAKTGSEAMRVQAEADCAQMIDKMFHYYLDVPVIGGWHDQIGADGKVTSNNMPSSTFYHIFCAAAEIEGYLKASA